MSAETSTNPQIDHTDSSKPGDTKQEKIDQIADDMAQKGGSVEKRFDHSINSDSGGVGPGGGGIFSK